MLGQNRRVAWKDKAGENHLFGLSSSQFKTNAKTVIVATMRFPP